jgi:hypothetical protein
METRVIRGKNDINDDTNRERPTKPVNDINVNSDDDANSLDNPNEENAMKESHIMDHSKPLPSQETSLTTEIREQLIDYIMKRCCPSTTTNEESIKRPQSGTYAIVAKHFGSILQTTIHTVSVRRIWQKAIKSKPNLVGVYGECFDDEKHDNDEKMGNDDDDEDQIDEDHGEYDTAEESLDAIKPKKKNKETTGSTQTIWYRNSFGQRDM